MLARVEQPSLALVETKTDGGRFKPFEFQQKMKDEFHEHVRNGEQRICMIASVGAGKTFVAATILKEFAERGCQAYFLVKLNCLLDVLLRQLRLSNVHRPGVLRCHRLPRVGAFLRALL